jgi:hypothetical protein
LICATLSILRHPDNYTMRKQSLLLEAADSGFL